TAVVNSPHGGWAAAVALDGDGRIVATGSAGYYAASHDFVVARRNADGSPDASFAGDGAQTTEFAGAGADEAAALAIGSDGSIVAAGSSDDDEGFETTGTGDLVLARYAADGAPRPTFSGDGVVTDDRVQGASAVALQPDGRIVAAGRSGGDLAVVRYNADGTRDAGFGSAGIRLTDFGSGGDRASALTLAAGGKIVVAGSGGSDPMAAAGDFALARYDAGGAPDASFSGDGRVLADSGGIDSAKAVAIDGDGRIVIAGSEANVNGTDSNIAVLRFNADGSPDPSFSGDGRQTIDFGGIDRGAALALQPDDRIVVAGTARAGGDSDVAVARLNIDGSPDTSFSGDGKQTTDFGGGADGGAGVVVTAGGAIVVAGVAGGGETDFALVRYDAGGTPDGTFSGDGVTLTDFAGSDDRALALAAGPGETIVAAGGATITSSPDFALARYDNDEAEVIVDPPPAPPPPPAAAPPPAATPPPAAAPPAAAPPAVTPPLPPAAPADRRAPAATLSARAAQRLRPTIAIGLTCPQEACVAKVTATVRIAGGGATPAVTRALRRVTRSLARGSKMRLELRLPSALRTTIRRALLRRRPVTVAVRSTVSDAAGNARVVKLARPIRLAL
ncbi:MAG: hypothetical protein QOJ89_1674, partial [bacterium]